MESPSHNAPRVDIELASGSVDETVRIAAGLAQRLAPGDVVALCGELGAGKTRFVEGACRALGYRGRVRSPSYTLLNVYRGRWPLHHLDLYRLEGPPRADELAEWEELMDGPGVTFIEWAERLGEHLPERAVRVLLAHAGGEHRRVRVSVPAGQLSGLIDELRDLANVGSGLDARRSRGRSTEGDAS
jgi:tRNA threonylcarbamoyladenosine biosynthesis protein TsaE